MVRSGLRQPCTWTAELLEDLPRSRRPAPFREIVHSFVSLEAQYTWHGEPEIKTSVRKTLVVYRS